MLEDINVQVTIETLPLGDLLLKVISEGLADPSTATFVLDQLNGFNNEHFNVSAEDLAAYVTSKDFKEHLSGTIKNMLENRFHDVLRNTRNNQPE